MCRGGVWDRAGSTGNGFFRNSGSSQCPVAQCPAVMLAELSTSFWPIS